MPVSVYGAMHRPTEALHRFGHDQSPRHMHFTVLPPHSYDPVAEYHPRRHRYEPAYVPEPRPYYRGEPQYLPDGVDRNEYIMDRDNKYQRQPLTGFLDMAESYEYDKGDGHHKHGYVKPRPEYTDSDPEEDRYYMHRDVYGSVSPAYVPHIKQQSHTEREYERFDRPKPQAPPQRDVRPR